MPLTPKFTEHMVRIKTKHFTIRFWFSERVDANPEITNRILLIRSKLETSTTILTPIQAAEHIEKELPDRAPLSAMEVLMNWNHGGVVRYYEWP